VGGTATGDAAATVGPIGSTVTWITDWVGLNNMVNVALACLIIGIGGDIRGKAVLGANPIGEKGPKGRRGGNIVNCLPYDREKKNGLGGPIQNGNCAQASPLKLRSKTMMIKGIRHLYIGLSPS
jgi:hypothetical protein